MKKLTNRMLSMVLVLAMCLSFLCGIDFTADAATVDYVYAEGIIKNWGVRGTTATFLSQNAEAFYEDNNTSYEALAALSGATSTSNVPSSALFKKLHTLMFNNIDMWSSYTTEYGETRYQYQYTDCQNSGKTSNKISSFYSGAEIGPAWDGGSTWNREHTWPNSKGTGAGGTSALREADIMMLRPASVSENSGRNNTAYGEGSGYYNPYLKNSGTYDVRGDVARIALYVYTCWGGHSDSKYHNGALEYMWGTGGVIESKEILLKWMEIDPVDTWELGRNDSVESITGTRNVFVDYPELAFALFNEEIPEDYTTPSGEGSTSGTYTITAVSNNTAYGTVAVNGKIITATPKSGYEVAGYTVTSGSANVTRSGNNFTVTANSNVTIRINFQPRAKLTLQYAEYGTVTGSVTAYSGDTVVLPNVKNTPETGHTFVGWVTAQTGDVDKMPTLYAAGSSYTVTQNQVLHALYSRTASGSTGNSTQFEPYSGTLTAGDYIIVDKTNGTFAMNTTVSSSRLQYQTITLTNGNIMDPSADIIWHLESDGTYWTMYNDAKASYAAGTGASNKAKLLTSVTTFAQWTPVYKTSTTYEFINRGQKDKGVNPMLRKNGTYGFACYAENTNVGSPLYLYKRASGTVYYFTQIGAISCIHTNTTNVPEVAPECDMIGYTAGVYCNDCKQYISGHERIPSLDHARAYKEEGKAPTCTQPGYNARLYCPDCDVYLESVVTIPATGHSHVNGVCTVCGDSQYNVLVLTKDTQVSLELEEDLYVDLAGYDLSGQIVTNGFQVYGMDNTTDTYTCENIGAFSCVDEAGQLIQPQRIVAYGEKQYMAICQNGSYSFHRFFLGVTHMSLEPEVVGLGYKAAIQGDRMVFAELAEAKAFTFRVQLDGYNPVYRYFDSNELASGDPVVLRIRNYDVENYSETKLYAQVGITLNDGTVLQAEEVALTFRWLTEQVNANHTDYTAEQLAQFAAMLQKFNVVKNWDISNLI